MPRWNHDASPDAAAQAVRQRFATRMDSSSDSLPLLQLLDVDDPGAAPDPPAAPPRLRWRTPWRVAALLTVVAIGLIALHFWTSAAGAPTSAPLDPSTSVDAGAESGPDDGDADPPQPSASQQSEASAGSGKLLVHVAGAVQKPGVVSLPEGSRVFQAIDAAGGAASNAELGGLNLAEILSDGIKIYVPADGEAPQSALSGDSGDSGTPSAGGLTAGTVAGGGAKVNINTASVDELGTLPRVGPVTAQRIVDWRKEHGPFASVDELDAVDGIGPKLMESLKNLVTVQGG